MNDKERNEITAGVLTTIELAVLRMRDRGDINVLDNYALMNKLSHEIFLIAQEHRG